MNNKYYVHSRISEKKFRQIIQCFADDINAKQTSELTGLNRRTVTDIFRKLRSRLSEECQKRNHLLFSIDINFKDIILDGLEDYSLENEQNGEDNIEAILGIIFKNGQVYSETISFNHIYTFNDSEDILRDLGIAFDFGYVNFRFAKIPNIYNGDYLIREDIPNLSINKFWQFSKLRLKKFNGLKSSMFNLYLKECEWRFNNNSKNLYLELLKMLRENPLDKSF